MFPFLTIFAEIFVTYPLIQQRSVGSPLLKVHEHTDLVKFSDAKLWVKTAAEF